MSSNAALPLIPLPEAKAGELLRLVDGLDSSALWWLSGYAAGLASQPASLPRAVNAALAKDATPALKLSIVYGSQTGNAKRLAEQLAQKAEAAGIAVRLLRADAYPTRELKAERLLYIVISTQGDGDPPDDARGLVEFIAGKRAPELPELQYAVLGLGDSSYPQFCAIGRQLDERLSALGARRLVARGDADVDIDSIAKPWLEQALTAVREATKGAAPLATVTPLRPPAAPAFSREKPFAAELIKNQRVTGRGSDKDIRHVELSLEGSGLRYEPGDALGLWPRNPAALVDAVLDAQKLNGDTPVTHDEVTLSLREWLSSRRELTKLARPFVAQHAAHAGDAELNRILSPDHAPALTRLLGEYQIIDLLRAFPAAWSAEELVAALRPLAPRLYSIASSQRLVGDEAHLTVAHVQYEAFGSTHWGAASHQLAASDEGAALPIFIEHNDRFHLPKDTARDVIMIGPGTGVAPFRGFVQERQAIGATGRNWLFFGNPHFRSDFLYQTEWQEALRNGSLHRLDLAFSRDQAEKVYVQHRLVEQGRQLYAWIESGAHVYVCGDATRMAKDVHNALIEVAMSHGGKSREDAETYINQLQQQGRYARDVY
ncbi:assimilatory sulfite reductase (NADPH) flavoprotein subunit [Tahibacter amnicola]|uniref:Sulfite reductase [NADPH] flavoprotein alpha-component n=1 Tax=Tahibacter amnicola TaxID=2976241 RepID=A0ABY6BDM7_9GAMM|nr:assimilatory sulfite reductase (NADPH) flavoprotein subunit [Tahibacter amnicola]UXI67854.1 assimilatory sulfite reductase (NADPH) flavoprotein subunit [Tahibacter amnicola]